MITVLLDRLRTWLRQPCTFELTDAVLVRDGSAWLRISPTEEPHWFQNEAAALAWPAKIGE